MNIVVVGLGSMGLRRIRLLKKMNREFNIIGIDKKAQRRLEAEKKYNIKSSENLYETLMENVIECAFVCTSPLSHSDIITMLLESNINVFTEINLVKDGYDRNIKLAKEKNKELFLSSTFLYRDEIKEIDNILKGNPERVHYSYHVGQYLPDWHPWENIHDFFVGEIRTNGCREIFAIELPWIFKVFGDVENFKVVKNNISNLNIDYPDSYLVILEHKGGNKGVISVDVVSRKPVRNLEIYSEHNYLSWDGTPSGLYSYDYDKKNGVLIHFENEIDRLEGYSQYIIENAYYNEIQCFFDVIDGTRSAKYSFTDDYKILSLIDKIEE